MEKITYEMIQKANDLVTQVDIKGKAYTEVNQRIKAFRMIYPTGSITTELVSLENGVCVMKATVAYVGDDGEMTILGEGTAYEKENSTFINKTSYIENCETSAVGRALGMAGFGIDTSVASYEEVATAIANQNSKSDKNNDTPATEEQIRKLKGQMKTDNVSADFILNAYKIKDFKSFTSEMYENVMKNWSKVVAAAHKD